MKRSVTVAAAVSLAASSMVWVAQSAHAESYDGVACQAVDVSATVGATIVYTLPDDCDLRFIEERGGTPTVADVPGGPGRLLWQQQVERVTSVDTCPDGWGPTWAQWARGGLGGPTCVRVLDWGAAPSTPRIVSVTINTPNDWVQLTSESDSGSFSQWATGCAVTSTTVLPDAFYDDHLRYGCL